MSTLPTRLAIAATAALSRTSSRATSDTPSLASSASPFSSMSVAKTVAPFARKGERAGAADADGARGHERALALQAV